MRTNFQKGVLHTLLVPTPCFLGVIQSGRVREEDRKGAALLFSLVGGRAERGIKICKIVANMKIPENQSLHTSANS